MYFLLSPAKNLDEKTPVWTRDANPVAGLKLFMDVGRRLAARHDADVELDLITLRGHAGD